MTAGRRSHPRRRVPLVVASGALGLAAALLGVSIVLWPGAVAGVDEAWLVALRSTRGEALTAVAAMLDRVGAGIPGRFLVPAVLVAVLAWADRLRDALFAVVATLSSAVIVQGLKALVGRERPEDMLVASDAGSWPSGHAAIAATLAVVVGLLWGGRFLWAAGAVWVVAMSLARLHLGVHWLTDVLGGVLVGAAVALAVRAVLPADPAPARGGARSPDGHRTAPSA